jgi:hypothetical protein
MLATFEQHEEIGQLLKQRFGNTNSNGLEAATGWLWHNFGIEKVDGIDSKTAEIMIDRLKTQNKVHEAEVVEDTLVSPGFFPAVVKMMAKVYLHGHRDASNGKTVPDDPDELVKMIKEML